FAKRRPAWALIFGSAPLVIAGLLGLLMYAFAKEKKAEDSAKAAREAELDARRQAYHARIDQAWNAWNSTDTALVMGILNTLQPNRPDQKDLRGFEWYYLNKLCHSDLRTIPGAHTTVAFSPDGKLIAAAVPENTAKIWDRATGQEI